MGLRARAVTAIAGVWMFVAVLVVLPTPAHAEDPPAGLEIVVVVEDPELVFATDVEATWLVRNSGQATVAAGRAQLSVAHDPMENASDLTSATPAGTRPTHVAVVSTPELEPGEAVTFTTVIPSTNLPFSPLSRAGVYGTEVRWSERGVFSADAASDAFRSSPLIWQGFAVGESLELATILPIVFPDHSTPPTTPEQIDEQLLRAGTVERLIDSAERFGMTAAVDPKIVASVRAVGDAASVASASIAERLTSGTLDTFALGYADADPVIQLTAGSGELLDHGGLSFLSRHYRGEASMPRGPALTTWDTSLDNATWPAPGSVSADTVALLGDHGLTNIILSGGNASGAARGVVDDSTVFVSTEELERLVTAFVTASTAQERTLVMTELTALTLLLSIGEDPDEAVPQQALLAVPRETATSGIALDPLFEHLESIPWVTFITPEGLDEGTIALHEPIDLDTQREIFAEALESEAQVREFSRVLEDPRLLVDHERDRVLTLIRAERVSSPALLGGAREVFRSFDESLLDGVQIIETEHTRLLGASSRIPVQLRNTLPFDAAVVGTVNAGSAALIVEDNDIERTVVPARSTVTHLVPVTTRVSSGESSLHVRIYDTDANELIETQRFSISISTGIEAVALWTLVTIAVALLGFGTFRSWIRHRR